MKLTNEEKIYLQVLLAEKETNLKQLINLEKASIDHVMNNQDHYKDPDKEISECNTFIKYYSDELKMISRIVKELGISEWFKIEV